MTEKRKSELNDELICNALELELQSLEAPPDQKKWERIESALQNEKNGYPSGLSRFNWSRAAVAAAACLVLVVSGIGLVRNLNISMTPLADDAVPEAADEVEILHTDEEPAEVEIMEEDAVRAADEDAPLAGEIDPVPPDWPDSLPGNYRFSTAVLFTAGGEPIYRGAIYQNRNADLLLVKKEPFQKDLFGFIDHLGGHIQLDVEDVDSVDGFVRFMVDEKPGLAWQDDSRNQALLVLSGQESRETLKTIAVSLE
ncbi:MAG: hypothetical protein ACQES4_00315 [Bacillota bacterium]